MALPRQIANWPDARRTVHAEAAILLRHPHEAMPLIQPTGAVEVLHMQAHDLARRIRLLQQFAQQGRSDLDPATVKDWSDEEVIRGKSASTVPAAGQMRRPLELLDNSVKGHLLE